MQVTGAVNCKIIQMQILVRNGTKTCLRPWSNVSNFCRFVTGVYTNAGANPSPRACAATWQVWKSDTMADGTWELVRDARDPSWPKCTYFRVRVAGLSKRTRFTGRPRGLARDVRGLRVWDRERRFLAAGWPR